MGRMGGAEIGDSWETFLDRADARRSEALADAARHEAMATRKEAALLQAQQIIARIGASVQKADPTQEQLTPYIPLGSLGLVAADGRAYGFARVFVEHDMRSREVITKGRFFQKVSIVHEVSDVASRFGVVLFAGMEDGSHSEWFDQAYWSIMQRGKETDEGMAKLEGFLQDTYNHLPSTEPS